MTRLRRIKKARIFYMRAFFYLYVPIRQENYSATLVNCITPAQSLTG